MGAELRSGRVGSGRCLPRGTARGVSVSRRSAQDLRSALHGLPDGSLIGPYRIIEELGCGGMGLVYRAVDELHERPVAIKVLRPKLAGDAEANEQLRIEALALA